MPTHVWRYACTRVRWQIDNTLVLQFNIKYVNLAGVSNMWPVRLLKLQDLTIHLLLKFDAKRC